MTDGRTGGRPRATFCLIFAMIVGCSSETLDDLKKKVGEGVDKVKNVGQEATDQVADQVVGANSYLQLEMGEALDAKACFISLTQLPGSRPAVLQFTSYSDAERESFPSVLIWAEVSSNQPDSLAGQRVKAQIYVQAKADGPVSQSAPGQPIEVSITKAGAQEFAGEIASGKIISSDGGASIDVRGKFGGALR
jgi:hypothetical protein